MVSHARATIEDMNVFLRYAYDGVAREVAVWWTLRREATKGEAVCRMFTHVFGHELRLEAEQYARDHRQ